MGPPQSAHMKWVKAHSTPEPRIPRKFSSPHFT
jgi:hypothetical protein